MLWQILIEVDEKLNINVHYNDKGWLAVALLWAVEVAKWMLLERIANASKTSISWGEKEIAWQEVAMKKDEAIGVYLKARKLIESRITAIRQADDKQEFCVNKSLLDTL